MLCRAVAPDTSRVFIAIGLGFHVEATLQEAGGLIERATAAKRAALALVVDQAGSIKAHLKFVSQALRELMGLPGS